MKLLTVISVSFLILICNAETLYAAKRKNLYNLVENKTLSVYLGSIESETDKISPDVFRRILKDFLLARKKETFEITDTKESAKIIINAKLLDYKYMEEDPIDNIVGGTSGLIMDILLKQSYARVDVEFVVIRVSDSRKLWSNKFYSTITMSEMSLPDSIPRVLIECCKRFVSTCFGKPR